jgi:hypothetical protein
MKPLAAISIVLAALGGPASAQVYGTNDNPYEVNPFASNMVVPQDMTPAPAASPGSGTPSTSPSAAAPQQQDSSPQQQTAAAGGNRNTKKGK